MKNLEFGKALCIIKELLMAMERASQWPKEDVKIMSKAYELLNINEKEANDYINYKVNYMMEKASKKKTVIELKESHFYNEDGSKKYD